MSRLEDSAARALVGPQGATALLLLGKDPLPWAPLASCWKPPWRHSWTPQRQVGTLALLGLCGVSPSGPGCNHVGAICLWPCEARRG